MSRGNGAVQSDIVKFLQSHPAGTTFEQLRWLLWEARQSLDDNGQRTKTPADLPNKWNTSVYRALMGLVDRTEGGVEIVHRRLGSVKEFVDHYPFKTLSGEMRQLRSVLLPDIAKWSAKDGPRPRYTVEANEVFYRERIDKDLISRARLQWRKN